MFRAAHALAVVVASMASTSFGCPPRPVAPGEPSCATACEHARELRAAGCALRFGEPSKSGTCEDVCANMLENGIPFDVKCATEASCSEFGSCSK